MTKQQQHKHDLQLFQSCSFGSFDRLPVHAYRTCTAITYSMLNKKIACKYQTFNSDSVTWITFAVGVFRLPFENRSKSKAVKNVSFIAVSYGEFLCLSFSFSLFLAHTGNSVKLNFPSFIRWPSNDSMCLPGG